MISASRPTALAVLVALALSTACSHASRSIRTGEELSSHERSQVVELELNDGSELSGSMISASGPTVLFQVANQVIPRRLDVSTIRQVTVRNRRRGAIEGAVIGGVGAAAALAGFGALGGDRPESCEIGCTPPTRALAFGIAGLLGGSLIGAAVGFSTGSRDLHPVAAAPSR